MKKLSKEKISHYIVYVAQDGTEFESEEQCRLYENSAKGVLLGRYHDFCDVVTHTEEEIFYFGSGDSNIDVVKMNKPEAIAVILQLFSLYNPSTNKDTLDNYLKLLQDYYEKGSTFFIGRSYDDNEFRIYKFDLEERLNHITKMCNVGKITIADKDEID